MNTFYSIPTTSTSSASTVWFNTSVQTTPITNTITTQNISFVPTQQQWIVQVPPPQATPRQQPRGFNRYVNASDLLEEFIGFLGEQGVRQGQVLGLPLNLLVKWLVIRACEEDQVEPNVTLELPAPTPQPRCIRCQRYLPKNHPVPYDRPDCAYLHVQQVNELRALAEAA